MRDSSDDKLNIELKFPFPSKSYSMPIFQSCWETRTISSRLESSLFSPTEYRKHPPVMLLARRAGPFGEFHLQKLKTFCFISKCYGLILSFIYSTP